MPKTIHIVRTPSPRIPTVAELFAGKVPTPKPAKRFTKPYFKNHQAGGPGNNNSGRVVYTGPGGLPLPHNHPYRRGSSY